MMVKKVIFWFFGVLFSIIIAFYLFFQTHIPQKMIHDIVLDYCQKTLHPDFKIKAVTGDLLSTVVFHQVSYPMVGHPGQELLAVDRVQIHYNLFLFFLKRNFLKSIEDVFLEQGSFLLLRQNNGIFYLPAFGQPSGAQFDLQDMPSVSLKRFTIDFVDQKGLLDNQTDFYHFSEAFNDIEGQLIFSDQFLRLDARGTLFSNGSPFVIRADWHSERGYDFNFSIDQLEMAHWNTYLLPFEGFDISEGTHQLSGSLRQRDFSQSGVSFWYELFLKSKGMGFDMPFLNSSLDVQYMGLYFFNDRLLKKELKQACFNTGLSYQGLFSQLVLASILDKEGKILVQNEAQLKEALPLALGVYFPVLKDVFSLERPIFSFPLIQSKQQGLDLLGKGFISLSDRRCYFSIQSQPVLMSRVLSFLNAKPTFIPWDPTGTFRLLVQGDVTQPDILGHIESQSLVFKQLEIDFLTVDFELDYPDASFSDLSLLMPNYQGQLMGKGQIHFDSYSPSFELSFRGVSLNMTSFFSFDQVTGSVDTVFDVTGDLNQFNVKGVLESDDASFFEQSLSQLVFCFNVEKGGLVADNMFRLYGLDDQRPLSLDLNQQKTGNYLMKVRSEGFPLQFNQLYFKALEGSRLFIKSDVTLDILRFFDFSSWSFFSGHVLLDLYQGILMNQPFSHLNLDADIRKQGLYFQSFSLKENRSLLHLEGLVSSQGVSLNIQPDTQFSFSDVSHFNFKGLFEGHGFIRGAYGDLDMAFTGLLKGFKSRFMGLDQVQGSFSYEKDDLDIDALLTDKGNRLRFSLASKTPSLFHFFKTLNQQDFELNLKVLKGDLVYLSDLYRAFKLEKDYFYQLLIPHDLTAFNRQFFVDFVSMPLFSSYGKLILYGADLNLDAYSFFDHYKSTHFEFFSYEDRFSFQGHLFGQLSLKYQNQLINELSADFRVKQASFGGFRANKAHFLIKNNDQNWGFSCVFKKGQFYHFPFDQWRFSGTFDSKGKMDVTDFGGEVAGFVYSDLVKGSLDLGPLFSYKDTYDLDLLVSLQQHEINVLKAFLPSIESIDNQGEVVLSLTGHVLKPHLDSVSVVFDDAHVYMQDSLKSVFSFSSQQVRLKNNRLSFSDLFVKYNRLNRSVSEGHFIFGADVSLLVSDSVLNLDYRLLAQSLDFDQFQLSFYKGGMRADQLALSGQYRLRLQDHLNKEPLQQRMTLKGDITLKEGVFDLKMTSNDFDFSYLNLDLDLDWSKQLFLNLKSLKSKRNVLIPGLSMFLYLRAPHDPIAISGSIVKPHIDADVFLDSGQVYLFNRRFDLLKPDQQTRYFNDLGKTVIPNKLSFVGSYSGLDPRVQVSLLSIVDHSFSQKVTGNVQREPKSYVHVVSNLSGTAKHLDEISFDFFDSQSNFVSPPDLVYDTGYVLNQQSTDVDRMAIVTQLVPEIDASEGENSRLATSVVNNQVNLLFKRYARPLERQLASNLGVDDIQFEYDLGGQLLDDDSDQNILGVRWAKNFLSDRLFFNVKTDFLLNTSGIEYSNQFVELSEIALTYYLLKQKLSINGAYVKDFSYQEELVPKFLIQFSQDY